MKLLQCWDDGVTTDVRLGALLRRHGAKASFNLNAALHAVRRQPGWDEHGQRRLVDVTGSTPSPWSELSAGSTKLTTVVKLRKIHP